MGILNYIVSNLLLFELSTNATGNCIRIWKVSNKRSGLFLIEQKDCDLNNMEKWKHSPAILLITGDRVISKRFDRMDTSIGKITENPELLWNLYLSEDSEVQTISFLRKELVEELIESLDRNSIYILEKWINGNETPNKKKILSDFYKKTIKVSEFVQNRIQANLLSLVIYYKLRLLLLIFFFIILLGNFLLNTRFRQEYEAVQRELYLNQRNNKQKQDDKKKQGRIQSQYESIPNHTFALIADRIASYVPPQVILNSLILSPLEGTGNNTVLKNKKLMFNNYTILIKGETEIPGSVSLFTQYLERDLLFSSVKILSFVKDNDSSWFTFELNIELIP